LLLDAGADPNEGYLWNAFPMPFTVLTGIFGNGEQGIRRQPHHPQEQALARLLLDAGADPNDGQTLYNRMFATDDSHLEVLFHYGLGRGDGGPWQARLGDQLPTPAAMLRSLLRWAVEHDQADRVALLARAGVDLSGPLDDAGHDAVGLARLAGNTRLASLLLDHGAPAAALDPVDELIAAVFRGDEATVLATPAEVVARTRRQRPGLIVWASAHGGLSAVELLLRLGFDVNAKGRADQPIEQSWETALHHAAANGREELTRLLLAAGADPTIRDRRFDATPLDWARHFAQERTAELITGYHRGPGGL
jgi:ankyrin repeat protein